ncbi:efflux RND transporter periplasmic adaptor subunit, partial [Candidatus Dependentiae bacterium]|nr:efflux RND transporter periplasmic adaptor subunit [Candidatus Dependentiae bacterium]
EFEVKKSTILTSLIETGYLEPIKSVEVMSKLSGKLLKFTVKEGESVKKDQLLGYLEPDISEIQRITSIHSNFENSKLELEIARKAFEDKQALLEKGIISEKEYLDSKKRFTNAENSFISSKQQLKAIEELGIEGKIESIDRVDILSPASGIVISLGIEEGESVRAGTSAYAQGTILAVIADLSAMKVSSYINEVDIGRIYLNQEVIITLDAFPREKYSGNISYISPIAKDVGNLKKFDILVDVLTKDKRLKPGLTANLDIVLINKSDILVIPFNFIQKKEREIIVQRKKDKSIPIPKNGDYKNYISNLEEVKIKLGVRGQNEIEVIEGLNEGDIIIFKRESGGDPKEWQQNRGNTRRRGRH